MNCSNSKNLYNKTLKIGLYIHIPFCKAKCYYCDFNSFSCKDSYISEYFEALKREIMIYSSDLRDYEVKTIFIGGGTPSSVDSSYLYEVMNLLKHNLNIRYDAEISMESNPGTLSYEKLVQYNEMGINRLSIGLQAWQNNLLKELGRIHTNEEFVQNFRLARKAGFKNINVDLIFGLPGQTIIDWYETLRNTIDLKPEHVSCYSLKIEDGTVFGKRLETGEIAPADDELDREMYYMACELLDGAGLKHYEISNFAKPGCECKHNLVYWKAEGYVGLGAGAHSYFHGKRYNNIYAIEDYTKFISEQGVPSENIQLIEKDEAVSEFIILGLRLIEGISIKEFKLRFGQDILGIYGVQIKRLLDKQLIKADGDRIKLTSPGLDLANEVFVEFI